jgi:G3E family GTPase
MSNPLPAPPTKARYIMIGGFLGSGKTTAVARLARQLSAQGLKVGLITNDQAGGLVDTRLLRSHGFPTEEIAGGCFCCRFNTLVEAASKLGADARPDVFIAEPVGSCTDLVATVTYPLRRMYGDSFTIAPLSVLVDPVRARRIFGLEPGGSFSSKVLYIFKKQLEEADIIAINKTDLIGAAQLRQLQDIISLNYPKAQILTVSTRHESGLLPWFDRVLATEQDARPQTMVLDYQVYADGEANLGWLNATINLRSVEAFDANDLLATLASDMQLRLRNAHAEIAHLKMTFSPDLSLAGELASINAVRNDSPPEPGMHLDDPCESGILIVNLRAESNPEVLLPILQESLGALPGYYPKIQISLEHEEHFRPGKPVPTYRDGGDSSVNTTEVCSPEARAIAAATGRPCC